PVPKIEGTSLGHALNLRLAFLDGKMEVLSWPHEPLGGRATMSIALAGPVAAYFAAEKVGDADALARCFAEHGVVRDEGGVFTGVTAIREWNAAARLKYHHTVEPRGA